MRLFSAIVLWAMVPSALNAASPKSLIARRVGVVEVKANSVTLEVDIECGEKSVGILVSEKQGGIELAAVVERPEVHCTGAPQPTTIQVPFLSTSEFLKGKVKTKKVESLLADDEESRINLQEVTVSATSSGLQVQWEKTCREPLGFLLAPNSSRTMQVAVAFKPAGKQAQLSCQGGRSEQTLTTVRTKSISWISMVKPGKIEDLYSYKLSAVTRIQIGRANELEIEVLKSCREMPVGVLFTGPGKNKIAVVNVFLPNMKCNHAGFTKYTMKLSGVAVNGGTRLTALSALELSEAKDESEVLVMTSTEKTEISRKSKSIQITSPISCDRDLGIVVGNDANGNLSVGALKSKFEGSCNVRLSRNTIPLPLRSASELTPRVFPLRVAGTLAH